MLCLPWTSAVESCPTPNGLTSCNRRSSLLGVGSVVTVRRLLRTILSRSPFSSVVWAPSM